MNPFYLSSDSKNDFDHVSTYIVCLRDDYVSNDENDRKIKLFYDASATWEQICSAVDLICVENVSAAAMNTVSVDGIVHVPGKLLKELSGQDYDETEAVYLMLQSKSSYVKKWARLYDEKDKRLFNYVRQKIFYTYNNMNDNVIRDKLINLISRISPQSCIDYDCSASMQRFANRKFYGPYVASVSTDSSVELSKQITELLLSESLFEKERLHLVCNLLINPRYHKFITTNATVLAHIKPLMDKWPELLEYIWQYTWIYMHDGEIRGDYDCKLDLDAVNALPVFNKIFMPRVITQASERVVDLATFKQRLNMHITGDADNDIFAGVDWTDVVVSGKIMAAIVPHIIRSNDCNVNIICGTNSMIKYVEKVQHIFRTVSNNVTKIFKNVREKDTRLVCTKSLTLFVEESSLKKKCDEKTLPFDFQYALDNIDALDVKHHFYEAYVAHKHKTFQSEFSLLGDKKNISEYYEIMKIADISDVNVVVTENVRGYSFSELLNYKIISKHLNCDVKIGSTTDVIAEVANMDVACMRSYYDGTNCYLYPTAVVACTTSINPDIKFMVGRDAHRILSKFKSWGYDTMLNQNENGAEYNTIAEVINSDRKLAPVKRWMIDQHYDNRKN